MFWKRNKKTLEFVLVSEKQSKMIPYPYVYIENNETARELHEGERKYLETPFQPNDGARPYVKNHFNQKDGYGEIKGYLLRSKLPNNITILPAPEKDPNDITFEKFIQQEAKLAEENGFEVIHENNKIIMRRKNQK